MHDYVKKNNFFVQNVSAGVEAVRNEWVLLTVNFDQSKIACSQLDAFIYDAVVIDYMAGKDPNCELMMVIFW